jgi:hypothetical protein
LVERLNFRGLDARRKFVRATPSPLTVCCGSVAINPDVVMLSIMGFSFSS